MTYTLQLRQRLTMLQNRYDISLLDHNGETSLAYAEQKRMTLREKITFYRDEVSRQTVFTLAARNVLELVGSYDITEPDGQVLATLRKDPLASMLRSTYQLETPKGKLTGRERTWWRPIARRVFAALSDLPWLLPMQFDFTDEQGRTVLAVERQLQVRDRYRVTVDDELDWRVAAACAVAVDALMDR